MPPISETFNKAMACRTHGQHLAALSSAVAALVTSIEVRVSDSEHSQRQDGEDTREHDESRLRK